ncbi:putative Serine-threonine protein kinase, plant-type [Hibiscus syriacus]|uniref:non-specific serine/threonine protein kinase n=1 Tax=Hibiscus syriacus TaxID=106335 RepID=A0A6A2X5T4_HIBSY|nr:putative receptor-like protein kinase At3g47110 isoform X1 [Hibiscus syriacus]KAE8670411.1 putative Serine-threonine protein kinase, plant-type [Hibiscus syriacus]
MEKSSLKIDCIVHFSFLLCIVAVITLVSTSFKLGMAAMGNETDRLALLAFKDQLVGGLLSWNASLHFCEWQGVRCGRRHQRVISLSLPAMNLGGSISPSVGNLSFLREANLFNNSLKGNIPSEFGQLRRLRSLNLNRNNLYGNIPMELGNCSSFVFLNLSYNSLSGELPSGLGDDMKNLITLSVAGNDLVGGIPSSLGNLSSLENLRLEHNHFEGVVPDSLGRLPNLKIFSIQENNLSGIIPSSIYNLSSLTHVSMGRNNLSGGLAPQLGFAFPNLVTLYLTENQFNGRIPRSVSNVSGLNQLDISSNGFSGLVPDDLGKLRNLLLFDVHDNDLGLGTEGDLDFLSSLRNCSRLQYLYIHANRLGGMLPDTAANLSAQLEDLYMGGNPISGSIPQGIGNLYGLTNVYFGESLLTGKLPVSIGQLQNLGQLDISLNHLSGEIPSSIGNLSRLLYLYLNGNDFRGTIPSTLRGCKDMEEMDLSLNKLGGTIPDQLVAAFQSLITLNLSHNSFNGTFPSDIRNSKNLVELYVDNNNFSGEISEQFGEISELKILHMQGNYFQGSIPRSLGSLRGLEILDLSGNNLSGPIPLELQKLPFLVSLNLSFNQLEGEVPEEGVFKNISGFAIIGNKDLCGGIPEIELPKCFGKKATEKRNGFSKKSIVVIIISLSLALISVAFIVILCWRKQSQKEMIPLSLRQQVSLFQVSYKELVEATNGFSALNFLGKGSFGSVYKGFLNQQENPVAVKVLNLENLGAVKSFIAECEVLRNIRHRNLVKLITCCSSINFQGNDFKAIVLEFMANGSLESWLHHDHGEGHSRQLDFAEMLNIAIDMANAIDYLHRHCRTPIVHRDLKPSNVLLDDDMVAHVSDFGMAKLLFCTAGDLDNEQTTSLVIKGTIGYLAPECGMGDPTSPEGDIYSYGIIILEMITGKRPTDDMFKDGISLHSLCKMALPEQVEEILDSRLLGEINERGDQNMLDCLVWFTNVGVACSVEVPDKRMKIEDVVAELVAIKARLHGIHV